MNEDVNLSDLYEQTRFDTFVDGDLPSDSPVGIHGYGACLTIGTTNSGAATIQFWVSAGRETYQRSFWNGFWSSWVQIS